MEEKIEPTPMEGKQSPGRNSDILQVAQEKISAEISKRDNTYKIEPVTIIVILMAIVKLFGGGCPIPTPNALRRQNRLQRVRTTQLALSIQKTMLSEGLSCSNREAVLYAEACFDAADNATDDELAQFVEQCCR